MHTLVKNLKKRHIMKCHPGMWLLVFALLPVAVLTARDSQETRKPTKNDRATELSRHLKPLARFVGKTYKGEFVGSTPEKPVYDISRWERALNGQAIRIMHSVNEGQYGGETIVMWDAGKKSLVSWYFTTAGFQTQATLTVEKGALVSHEKVTGNKNGITEVKATIRLLPDGRMHTKSQYLQKEKWVDGHEIHYRPSPESRVVFK